MIKKLIFLCVGFCALHECIAQSNSFWSGEFGYFGFKGHSAPRLYENSSLPVAGGQASLCENNGDLIVFSDFFNLYNRQFKVLKNGQLVYRSNYSKIDDMFFRINENLVGYIYLYDTFNTLYRPVLDKNNTSGLYFTIIDLRLDYGLGGVDTNNCNVLLKKLTKESNDLSTSIVRRDSGEYIVFSIINDSLWAFQIDGIEVKLLDSIAIDYSEYVPFPMSVFCRTQINSSLVVSNSGESICILKSNVFDKQFNVGNILINRTFYRSSVLNRLSFDVNTNKFTSLKSSLLLDSWIADTGKIERYRDFDVFSSNATSENDSFFYLSCTVDSFDFLNNRGNSLPSELHQIELLDQSLKISKIAILGFGNVLIKEKPTGEILVYQQKKDPNSNKQYHIFDQLNNPSSKAKEIVLEKEKYKFERQGASFYFFPRHVKDHIRLKYTIAYGCNATVRFENFSNPYMDFEPFSWNFNNENGEADTLSAENPSVTYNKSGDYFYKAYARSNKGNGYGEIWYDTLHIRIPPKPIAAFTVPDTIVCAYSQAIFINQSTTDTINQSQSEKWVWTFGDGTTQTVLSPESKSPVSHIYKKPGTYTVSLFYSNGFCDSTLVKNQYITVVDAPAPGFSVDNVQGCSPFTVNISDTVTLNTVKKEYNFYDGSGWQDLALNESNISQTYNQKGVYWVVQKLYGYTGCITQLDSVQIFVSPGFTTADTLHVNTATYENVLPNEVKSAGYQTVTVDWDCREDVAVKYVVRRNGQKIGEKSAACIAGKSQFIDTIDNNDVASFVYVVSGLDSCGTATQVGRIGQPIFLTGEVKGNNELSILQFNNYLDWNVGINEINYTIQTENDGIWQSLASQTKNADYTDKQFLDLANQGVKLEKCYRIVGESSAQKTISNILCLPYTPVLFIPTAITPNADGLNDVFKPITFGIESYNVQIFNRWGQLVADFDETAPGWAAKEMPQGAYIVTIRAKGNDNNWYTEKSTVTVVR